LNFFFEIYATHGHLKGYKLECGKDMMRLAWRGSNVAKRENRTFNTETEVINLCIAVEALDEMINHRLLRVVNVQGTGESEVRYRSEVHQQLFTILLLDFIYENRKKVLPRYARRCRL